MTTKEDVPVLWLGAAGFSAEQRQGLADIVRCQPTPDVQWEFCVFPDADAWLICGERAQVTEDRGIRISPGEPTQRIVRLNLDEVNRPVAFSLPLPDALDPLSSFDLQADESVAGVLQRFGEWLLPRRVQITLGREIVNRGSSLRHAVFHLMDGGKLLAVMNFMNGQIGYCARVSSESLARANWGRRPASAGDLPPGFVRTTVAQLSWTYVRHTERILLPERYYEGRTYLRGSPKVPLHWISDSQLALLRELSHEPANMHELRQRTALRHEQLVKDLTCLYYAGAITSSPGKARAPAQGQDRGSCAPEVEDLMRATEPPPQHRGFSVPTGLQRQYATVPAPLMTP
jgi:hypothetical protein